MENKIDKKTENIADGLKVEEPTAPGLRDTKVKDKSKMAPVLMFESKDGKTKFRVLTLRRGESEEQALNRLGKLWTLPDPLGMHLAQSEFHIGTQSSCLICEKREKQFKPKLDVRGQTTTRVTAFEVKNEKDLVSLLRSSDMNKLGLPVITLQYVSSREKGHNHLTTLFVSGRLSHLVGAYRMALSFVKKYPTLKVTLGADAPFKSIDLPDLPIKLAKVRLSLADANGISRINRRKWIPHVTVHSDMSEFVGQPWIRLLFLLDSDVDEKEVQDFQSCVSVAWEKQDPEKKTIKEEPAKVVNSLNEQGSIKKISEEGASKPSKQPIDPIDSSKRVESGGNRSN